jgi:hypothetical protein
MTRTDTILAALIVLVMGVAFILLSMHDPIMLPHIPLG